ncbi:MAG TPA: serine/threonine-protein kinase, partial [Candidatus Acidoferrales bacterium]|nr:serine/threonine-protein kinase [Candidatus Acidoferrales bacterium]
EREAVDYVDQVLGALSYAHARGVVHRDIKPANMMLTRAGVIKLMDFGIARAAGENKLTQTGSTLGSIYYMSPEQVQGQNLDSRSDLYSLGVSLYEMVTAQHPFEGDTGFTIMKGHIDGQFTPPRDVNPMISAALNDVIVRSMAKNPDERYQNADEFAGALQGVRRALAGSTRSIPAVAPPVVSPSVAATTPSRPAFTQVPAAAPPPPATPAPGTQAQAMAMGATGGVPPAGSTGRSDTGSHAGGVTGGASAVPAAPAPPAYTPPAQAGAPSAITSGAIVPPAQQPVPRSSRAFYLGLGAALAVVFIVLAAMKLPVFNSSSSKPAATTPSSSQPAQPPPTQPVQPAASATPDAGAATASVPVNPPAESPEEKARRAHEAAVKKQQEEEAARAAAEAQAKAEAEAKLFDEQDQRFIHMSARAEAVKTSFETLRNQQAASGFAPNQGLSAAYSSMQQFMSRADAALSVHDGATAKKYMDMAEPQIEILERKFGR